MTKTIRIFCIDDDDVPACPKCIGPDRFERQPTIPQGWQRHYDEPHIGPVRPRGGQDAHLGYCVPGCENEARRAELLDWLEDGKPVEVPTTRKVCWRCHGNGVHTRPGIDDHGLSADDFAEDPDFAQDYFSGVYDVVCSECHGRNVTDEIDWERFVKEQPEMAEAYERDERERAASAAEAAAERRMGA